jgi:hypothetical protein
MSNFRGKSGLKEQSKQRCTRQKIAPLKDVHVLIPDLTIW